jgi:unsaturated chondroitin disaccharide hydrolase
VTIASDSALSLAQVNLAFEFAQTQVRSLAEKYPGFYPLYTEGGHWRHSKPAWTHWCDGFLPGMMWIFYEETGAAEWRELAESYSRPLEPRKADRDVHDLGFIFYHGSYKRWYDTTVEEGEPQPALKEVVIEAGRTMALRFNPLGGFLRSFHGPDSMFIDIMMNVGIIFYAALETGDEQLAEIAHRHCQTTRRLLIRADGSTAQEGIFDLRTGEFLRQSTQQGFSVESCWSRGLAWSLYGFASCYELTGERAYLQAAQANADYWLAHADGDGFGYGVVPWDFDAPRGGRLGHEVVDTSASAIAAAGLLSLAGLTDQETRREAYLECAKRTLGALTSEYLAPKRANARKRGAARKREAEDARRRGAADEQEGWEGILRGGVYHIHKDLGVNESVMWGEFFFVEALQKMMRLHQSGS